MHNLKRNKSSIYSKNTIEKQEDSAYLRLIGVGIKGYLHTPGFDRLPVEIHHSQTIYLNTYTSLPTLPHALVNPHYYLAEN